MPTALTTAAFLASLGLNTHIDQGADPNRYVTVLRYTGIQAFRTGPNRIDGAILLHQQTGAKAVMFANCGGAGQINAARQLAAAGALLALEGSNEPNNFPCSYNGIQGGGSGTWKPIAQAQGNLYSLVKADAALSGYPVYGVSETGAETDNVGLQWATTPAGTLTPEGTRFFDYANVHNYVAGHLGSTRIDNQAWGAADPVVNGSFDGLHGNHGVTWRNHFQGYSNTQLPSLPRVTTETGYNSAVAGEAVQGKILTNTYLAQFTRGWSQTFIYQAIENEGGTTETQGIYNSNMTPKLAATYIRNLTTPLTVAPVAATTSFSVEFSREFQSASATASFTPGSLAYTLSAKPSTVHDLLLQKDATTFDLILWGERVSGSDAITVSLGTTFPSVKVYDVTSGTTPIASYTNVASLPVTLSDHALIIEASGLTVTPPPPPPPGPITVAGPISVAPYHVLTLNLAEDAWNGNAQVRISTNGYSAFPVGQTVTALNGSNQQQVFTIKDTWKVPPVVVVTFTNDSYGGSATTDRNLYLVSGTYDGKDIAAAPHTFMSNGSYTFTPPP